MGKLRDLFSLVLGAFSTAPSHHDCQIDMKVQQMIAKAMTEDPHLFKNWRRFYDALYLKHNEKAQLERIMVPYDLYMAILEQWRSTKPNATIGEFQQILRNQDFKMVAELIMKTGIPEDVCPSVRHGLRNKSSTFIGRDREMEILNKFYELNDSLSVVVVSGLGGVGKTELVTAFAWNKVKENNVNVVWLNGDSEDILKECINNFVNFGCLGKQAASREQLVDSFNACLSKHLGKWIIVFDNVDEVNPFVDFTIDNLQSKGKEGFFMILVTSRNLTCIDYDSGSIALDKFSREDSKKLVETGLKQYINAVKKEDVDALCDALQDFPLALQQAIAYIKLQKKQSLDGESYSIDMYLDKFRSQPDRMLDPKIARYGNTTLNTVNITIEKLSKEDERGLLGIEILKFLAFVNPDDLRFKFLKTIYKLYSDKDVEIESAVRRIKCYSLIKAEENVISIHRLVQTVVRLNMEHDIEKTHSKLVKVLTTIPCKEVQDVDIEHVKSMWTHLLGSEVDKGKLSLVPQNISEILLQHSYFDAALNICIDSLDKFKDEFEKNLLHKLKVKFNSARCYNFKEHYQSAIKILDNVDAVVKEKFESDYDFIAAIKLETASVQRGLKNLVKSGELYASAHALTKEKLGETHVRTMTAKHGLGIVLLDLKKYLESYSYLKEVYEWRIANLGADDPSTYRTQYYLGRCLYENGQLEESKEILETALKNEHLYHDGHTHTMLIFETIVKVYVDLKENPSAINIQMRICEVHEKTLGRSHVKTHDAKAELEKMKAFNNL